MPWAARCSNQSILKEINLEYSLEGLMLKLKLQYFGYLMRRANSLEKTLMLGKIGGRRRLGYYEIYYWYGGLKVVQNNHMQFCVQDWILLLRAGNGVTEKSCQAYLVWNKSNYGINDKDLASASLFGILEAFEQAKAEMTSEAECWQ